MSERIVPGRGKASKLSAGRLERACPSAGDPYLIRKGESVEAGFIDRWRQEPSGSPKTENPLPKGAEPGSAVCEAARGLGDDVAQVASDLAAVEYTPPRNLLEQADLVRRALKADSARIEGLAVEIYWTRPGSVEVQRWSWEHQQS